jgi:TP901 family phage tail tape measure protein
LAKNSKEYELAIKIAGEVEKSFLNSSKLTKRELQNIAKQASDTSNSLGNSFDKGFTDMDKGFSKMSSAASKSFNAVKDVAIVAATAIAAITVASATAGIAYESAFAGVKKTTEATTGEYEKLRQSILDMSTKEIPATANEIAAVAEVAGQLGVEKDNLLDFSSVMIDLGESTNLSATEASSSLAKFANITGMSVDKYSNLGSVIVEMGNNFATTEADIVSMGTRLAASGDLAGLSETQIMALSTAMSSVGIESEAGGSAMSKLLKKMQVSVETEDGLLKQFAKAANMTSGEFQKAFQKDAVGALSAFIDGLNDTERNGKSATVILDDMGLTEVRLSNTILSLANSNGLMTEAVNMANGAWEENTALSEEAAKRYATNESKLKIWRNSMTGIGIQLYDEFSEPMGDAVEAGTDFANNLSDEVIPTLMDNFKEKLPTVVRKVKEFTSAFIDFSEPVISMGKWLLKNPDVITSTLVGIGSSIATYKVAKGINSIAKGFKSLSTVLTNPYAASIMAVGLAIGGAIGLATYISKLNKEMAKQNLAEHFGDIALSIGELETAAHHIVGSDYFGQLESLMSSVNLSEGFLEEIKEATKTINKTNWKLSVGLEISEEELANYDAAARQYVKSAQDYITNQGYTVEIATKLLLGSSGNSTSMNTDNNAFYSSLYNQVSELSTELNGILNEALESGLTIDTEQKIAELLTQIDQITTAVSQAESNAKLQVIQAQFSGKDLDAETFQNLQSEIASYTQSVVDGANTALQESLKSINAQLELGYLTQGEYDNKYDTYMQGYYKTQADAILKGYEFMRNTITDTYEKEIDPAIESVNKAIKDKINKIMTNDNWWNTYSTPEDWSNGLNNVMLDALKSTNLSKDTQDAIAMLLKGMLPTQEQLKTLSSQITEVGGTVPNGIVEAMKDTETLAAITGSEDDLWKMIGSALGDSKEYSVVIETAKINGGEISQTVIDAMLEKQPAAEQTAKDLLNSLKNAMGEGFDVTVPIGVRFKTASNFMGTNGKLPGYADGGIITSPTIASFAEKVPEAAIPLDGSSNSIGLWKTVGRILGVYTHNSDGSDLFRSNQSEDSFGSILSKVPESKSGGSKSGLPNITYSPNYNFYGSAPTKDDMVEAARMSQEEFNEMMDEWTHGKDRLSLA